MSEQQSDSEQRSEKKGRADSVDKLVSRRLKMRRMILGLSQNDLGKAVDVSIQQVQKYEKATNRIIKAVENPFTSILGHPTGRLLLSRQGYPIDHKKIIDACAENGVSIELNANPYRLDLDWTWIPYATEKGVLISINPDAHSTQGILDIHYGVLSARKGGLTKEQCLNAYSVEDFLKNLKK